MNKWCRVLIIINGLDNIVHFKNSINILDCKIIVLIDNVHGNHWRFVMLLNMHTLSNANSDPDELCGFLCYDPCSFNSMTVNHGDCIGTFIDIACSFQQMCTSNEWLNTKDKEEFGNSFKFQRLIEENCDNIKNCPL